MEKAVRSKVIEWSKETAILISAIAAAVLLPQMVHGVGVLAMLFALSPVFFCNLLL